MDIEQTNMVTTIANITKVMNEEQKFPEMDAYCVSKIYQDWLALGNTPDETVITTANALEVFDKLMLKMDNARVPVQGRILYVTNEVKYILKSAQTVVRNLNAEDRNANINRVVDRLDEVEVIGVAAPLMKTKYNFSQGWKPALSADQINMLLIHPTAVITPVSYTFSKLDEPAAGSEGKYIYFEESFEDVFILNNKAGAIQFNITDNGSTTTTG